MISRKALEMFGNYDKKSLLAGITVGQGMKGRARAPRNPASAAPAGFPQDLWDAANRRADATLAAMSATEPEETQETPDDWQFDKDAFCFGVAAGRSLEGWEIDGGTSLSDYGKIVLFVHLDEPDEMRLRVSSYNSSIIYIDFGDGEAPFFHNGGFYYGSHNLGIGDYIVTIIGANGLYIGGITYGTSFYFASDRRKSPYSVYIEGNVALTSYSFYEMANLNSVTFNQKRVSMGYMSGTGSYDFGYSNVESVYITDLAEHISIGQTAFIGCANLRSINFPKSPISVSIGGGAFSHCTALTSVNLPDGLERIGNNTFWDCVSLASVTIGDGVTDIDSNAFCNCASLTSVTIPDSIANIWGYAFQSCYAISDVYYKGSEEQRNAIHIGNERNEPLVSATWHYNSSGPD